VAADPEVTGGGARRCALVALLLATFAVRLAVDLATTSRGYELGDEGFFLLNLNQPEAALPSQEIYRFLAALSGGAEIGVVAARRVRIAVELLGSFALLAGVHYWARRRLFAPGARTAWPFAALAMQGALLSVGSRSLGYNDFTNLFSYSAVGALFVLMATPPAARARQLVLAAGLGLATGLQLITKSPSAAMLAVLASLIMGFALPHSSLRVRLQMFAAYAAAIAALVALVVATTGGPEAMAERLAIASRLPALVDYNPKTLILRYLWLDQFTLLNLGVFWTGFAFAYLAADRWRAAGPRGGDGEIRLAVSVAFGAVVLLGGVWRFRPNFLHPSLLVLACLATGAAVALLVISIGRSAAGSARREKALPFLVLLATPLVAIAGTYVPVTMRLPAHILPIFALLALLALERRRMAGPLYRTLAGALLLVTAVVFVHHHWLRPYGLRAPIHAQTEPLALVPGVRADLASVRFLEAVASTLADAGFRPGDPLIALDYMPGLVNLVGGTSPRYNLYIYDQPAYLCFNLRSAKFERPPFLAFARPPAPWLLRCLEPVSFPDDYRLLRTLRFPYDSVYVTFGAHDFSHLHLYGPRSDRAPEAR
jgi:hypothetical protein